jgi:hypothetical protein
LAKFRDDFVRLPVVDGGSLCEFAGLRRSCECGRRACLLGPATGGPGSRDRRASSMMPKNAKQFSDDIMLSLMRVDHVHDFGSIRSKIIVIYNVLQRTCS